MGNIPITSHYFIFIWFGGCSPEPHPTRRHVASFGV